jgi:hypothetical protein
MSKPETNGSNQGNTNMTHSEYCIRFEALKSEYRAGRITLKELNDQMEIVLKAYRSAR